MSVLSDDAKCLLTGLFGMSRGGATVTFHMQESKPTARCQAALDELVAKNFLEKKPLNKISPAIVYTVCIAPSTDRKFRASFALMERNSFPITESA